LTARGAPPRPLVLGAVVDLGERRRLNTLSSAAHRFLTRQNDDHGVSSPTEALRVVIADDHHRYRAALARELSVNGNAVVAEVSNAAAAIAAAVEHAPDVLIMDLNMPGVPAVEAIRILGEHVGTRVLVLTVSAEAPDITDAMLSGAAGYVLKDDLPEDIDAAVRAAAAGESPISPRAAAVLLTRARGRSERAGLARQEIRVLELLADGRPGREIVETLTSSSRTVRENLVSILLKLAVDERRRSLRVIRGRVA
jgi:DNA-binding NarL/FixJ family response regulator